MTEKFTREGLPILTMNVVDSLEHEKQNSKDFRGYIFKKLEEICQENPVYGNLIKNVSAENYPPQTEGLEISNFVLGYFLLKTQASFNDDAIPILTKEVLAEHANEMVPFDPVTRLPDVEKYSEVYQNWFNEIDSENSLYASFIISQAEYFQYNYGLHQEILVDLVNMYILLKKQAQRNNQEKRN